MAVTSTRIYDGGSLIFVATDSAQNAELYLNSSDQLVLANSAGLVVPSISVTGNITGTFVGNVIAVEYGGTGIGDGVYAKGDMLYAATADPSTLTRLTIGSEGNVLISNASGLPAWSNTIGKAGVTTTVGGDLVITGNLTVSGTSTVINTTELQVEDTIITVNSLYAGAPTAGTFGMEVNRGSGTKATLLFHDTGTDGTSYWKAGLAGSEDEIVLKTKSQALTNKTYNALTLTALSPGFSIAGGTKTVTHSATQTFTGTDNTTLSLAGNLTTSGAYAITLTATNATSVTLPTTGTLATLAGTETFTNKNSYNGLVVTANTGVITTGTWNATTIGIAYGGTGITTVPTNGQIPIGNGTGYVVANITGTANRVTVTNGAGTITLNGPQDIHTTASPTFTAVNIGATNTTGQAVPGARSLTITQESGGNVTITNSGTAQDLTANRSWTLGWTGTLGVTRGGTGLSSITSGGMYYASGSNTVSVLAIGSAGKILRTDGSVPSWWPSAFSNQVLFVDSTSGVSQGTLYWDNTSKTLSLTHTSSTGTISQNATHQLTIYPGDNSGTIRLGGTGAVDTKVLPGRALGSSLGSGTDKFLKLYASELEVGTLIAKDTLATTGGRVVVAYSTKLINTVLVGDTNIQVEHNNLSLNDFVMLEARGTTEHMKVGTHATPDAGKIYKSVAGGFEYTVTRDMDKTGANQWEKGDSLVNTGNGFIEMFSEWGASGVPLDYIYNYNNTGAAFSANYNNATVWSPFGDGANTEINDAVYFGQSDGGTGSQWSNLYFYINTAAVYTATLVWEFWNGTAWTSFTPTVTGAFTSVGWMSVEWTAANLTNWAANTVNTKTSFWVRCRISAFTSFGTLPSTGKFRVYSRRKNVGPTIVGNVRNGSTNFNDWTEHWAIGNLNGLYGYGTDTYGVGLGKYGTTYATLDATDGYKFYNNTTLVSQWDASGNITVGPVSATTSNVYISAGKIQLRKNTTTAIELDSTGAAPSITIGTTSNDSSRVTIDSTNGIQMISKVGSTDKVLARWFVNGTLRVGEQANDVSRIEISSGALNFITRISSSDITYGSISSAGVWTVGRDANSHARVQVDGTNGIQLIYKTSGGVNQTMGQWDLSGNLILGRVATGVNNLYFNYSNSSLEFRNNTTVLGSLSASVWTLGASNAQKVTIDTNGVKLFSNDGSTVLGEFAATTKLGIQTGNYVEISAANGVRFMNNTTVRAIMNSTNIIMGDPTAGTNTGTNTYISDSYVALRKGTTDVVRLNSDGSGFVSSGKITWNTSGDITVLGTMNATAGYIGSATNGWNIGSTGISSNGTGTISVGTMKFGNDVESTNDGLYINANNYIYTTGAFKFGTASSYISGSGSNFNITVGSTDAFSLTATNLSVVSGAANTANITVGTGSNAGGLNSANAGTDVIFWGGNTHGNRASAPFRVTAAGALTATSGAIAGWDIDSAKIYKTNIHINSGGYISMGLTPPTTYGNNVGAWFGYSSGAKMSLYADANNYLQWDGAKLLVKAANFTLDASGNLTAASATITGTINATAGAFTSTVTLGNAGNAGVIQSYNKTSSSSGDGFFLSGAANGASALFDLRSTNYFFNWNGTTLTYKAANTELDASGNLWAKAGGFGNTSAAPKVLITTEGLEVKDGATSRLFFREAATYWDSQAGLKASISTLLNPGFELGTAGAVPTNWALVTGSVAGATKDTAAGSFSVGTAGLKMAVTANGVCELISDAFATGGTGLTDIVLNLDYKSSWNMETLNQRHTLYIKIVETTYTAIHASTNVIKTFTVPLGTGGVFIPLSFSFATSSSSIKIVIGVAYDTSKQGAALSFFYDNLTLFRYTPVIELSKSGLLAYTSDNNYVKVGIGGLEIKGGQASFESMVIKGDLQVYGTQTVYQTANGLSGTTAALFTLGSATTPGATDISLQYGNSSYYLKLNTGSTFEISHAISWPGGSSTNANTAYTHSQDTTGAVHGATSANTANMIVRRDGSGNFTAGTITAALSGNASTASAWATGRTIALTGNVTGTSAAWTGSGNISFATTIANLAVTNAMLAGSITDDKLSTITTAGKVSGTAITSGNIDTAGNININTAGSMFKYLGTPINQTHFVDYSVGSGIAQGAVLDLESANATWTPAPVAGSRKFTAGANRVLVFVDGRLMKRGASFDYIECNVGGTEVTSGTTQYIKFLFDIYSGGTITLVIFAV